MQTFWEWLRGHRWVAFLLHQAFLFILAVGFLSAVRTATGRAIHLGRDPIGLVDGIALVLLSAVVVCATYFYYRILKGRDAAPLGLKPSFRRMLELLGGLGIGFGFFIAPWLVAISQERATISGRIEDHFDTFSISTILATAFFLLLVQAITEETANRAFPIRLWEDRTLIFRLLVPALFFAIIHFVNEPFEWERLAILMLAGILQGLAYVLTGNIWFTTGIHTGANVASFSITGSWYAGAVVSITGEPAVSNTAAATALTVVLALAVYLRKDREKERPNRPSATS